MTELGFGARLSAAFAERGQLCVGIDPHPFLLEEWGLTDSAEGVREFGLRVVDAVQGRAGILKPQVAFFERHGAAGYSALESVLQAARDAGLLVIADVKRGDLGTSVEAYGQAWLTPGSPLEADAMTISAFQGVGSISAPVELAQTTGKGLFVLAATSNPESISIQTARVETGDDAGKTVAGAIVSEVIAINSAEAKLLGSVGIVLGATVLSENYGIRVDELAGPSATPVLAPGFGHQGALFSDIRTRYGAATPHCIVAVSRGVLSAGPDGLAEAVSRTSGELLECLA
jgi:orotidine-5'-phosphate decarboxylase